MEHRPKHKPLAVIFLLSFVFLMSSCLGVNMNIALNQNGSGTIALEYRISRTLDALGRLDGNERWNTIPIGRADFERTVDRLPDIKLISFSSREDGKNLLISAKLEFTSLKGLLAFLDAGGRRSSFSGDARSGSMVLSLSEGAENINSGLNGLIAAVCESYTVDLSMNFPSEGSLSVTDRHGKALAAGNDIIAKGKRVSCSFPLYEIFSSGNGINVEFLW